MVDFRVVKVFISSRDHLLDERKSVERVVNNMGFQPILGDVRSQPPSANNKEWLALVKTSDITILIIADEDSSYVREEIESCISEGKSVLVLKKVGKSCMERELKEFLEDMYQYAFVSEFTTCTELYDKVKEGIIIELSNKYRERGDVIVGSVRMFKEAFDLIHSAKKQLILIIRTPPFLFPSVTSDSLDVELGKRMEDWVEDKIIKWSFENKMIIPEGRYFYILPAVKEKIGDNKNLLDEFLKILEKYKDIELNSQGRFKITSITQRITPLVIADEKVCYYSPVIGREGFGISVHDNKIADGIINFVESHYVNYYKTIDDLKKELMEMQIHEHSH